MMRRFFGGLFETIHVLGVAVFFAVGGALTLFSAPSWLARISATSPEQAARHFYEVASLIGRHGWWIAAGALLAGAIAPYARGDGKKIVAWLRLACATVALVIVIAAWGAEGSQHILDGEAERGGRAASLRWHSDKAPTPWNGLLAATGLNLLLGAFQISGGAGKKPKGEGEKK